MRIWAIVLLMLLSACSQQAWMEKWSSPQERALAERMAVAVRDGDAATLWSKSVAGLQTSLNKETIAQMHGLVPPGPLKLESVVVQSQTSNGTTLFAKTFVYEIGAGQRWALIRITLFEGIGEPALGAAYIQPFDQSPIAANNLTLEGKGAINYLWIAAMATAVVISLTGFVRILRTRGLKLKWLWAIGSLLGFVNFRLDWTTGQWDIWPVSFTLFGASALRSGSLAPWVMSFAIPIVAILFLALRARGKLPIKSADDPEPETVFQ